jgi:hypothetical protein
VICGVLVDGCEEIAGSDVRVVGGIGGMEGFGFGEVWLALL